jgi:hypothetical protein
MVIKLEVIRQSVVIVVRFARIAQLVLSGIARPVAWPVEIAVAGGRRGTGPRR